ncbi:MAG: rod shape-determining protein MreD [Bacteroidales bacterium]
MGTNLIKQVIIFVFFILLQVLVLDNIMIFGMFNPILYTLPIILMPRNTSTPALMFLAMMQGGLIDIFNDTLGINAAASILLAFVRNPLLSLVDTDQIGGDNKSYAPIKLPLAQYAMYICPIIFLHHLALYSLEAFSFSNIISILLNSTLNAILTVIILIIFKK